MQSLAQGTRVGKAGTRGCRREEAGEQRVGGGSPLEEGVGH